MDFECPNDPQSQQFSKRIPIKVLLNKVTHSCGIGSCKQVDAKLKQKRVGLLGNGRTGGGGHRGLRLPALEMR